MKMKHFALSIFVIMLLSPCAHALVFSYEFEGIIDYTMNLNDPYVDVGTPFKISGMWGDRGGSSTLFINNQSFDGLLAANEVPFSVDQGPPYDYLYHAFSFDYPLGIWHLQGQDPTMALIDESGNIDWEMFGDLDWTVWWIAVAPDDPSLPSYWEDYATITSAHLNTAPVPEPATILLLALGITGIISRRKFSKIKKSQ